jgi:hypothetical protein
VIEPEIEFAPLTLRMTPVEDEPEPVIEIASDSAMLPVIESAPVLEIVVEPADVPSEPEFDALTMPVEMVVVPV